MKRDYLALVDEQLDNWRWKLWEQASQPLALDSLWRALHVGALPLPWPEFNERAKRYFRAKIIIRRGSKIQFRRER